jgi:glycosyltransferase involved in cell wall biosynthesis
MRIAFYAPMKPPDHPSPSGDRRIARELMQAFETAGHEPFIASRLRTWQARADAARQERHEAAAMEEATALLAAYEAAPQSAPALWFTYHLYYKAPDWIGPRVAAALSIPYVVAEASVAYKRAGGPWDRGHRAVLQALDTAAAVVTLNPLDAECLPDGAKVRALAPFLDTAPYRTARAARADHRATLTETLALDNSRPWLLAVAMMRSGDKLRSYLLLAEALASLPTPPWHLLIVGDGPAAGDVRAAFAALGDERIRFLGARGEAELPALYAAADLLVWPAINEAYGMALLEAQAAGLPVLAGESPGVAAIVTSGATGRLVPAGRCEPFAHALAEMLDDPGTRARFGARALEASGGEHDLGAAARRLGDIVREVSHGTR